MTEKTRCPDHGRRTFLRQIAGCGGALAIGSYANRLTAQSSVDWSKQIGIQLTVVRDRMLQDVESTLAQLAAIGYRFVNPVGFSGFDAKAYRAMLDRHGLMRPANRSRLQYGTRYGIGPGGMPDPGNQVCGTGCDGQRPERQRARWWRDRPLSADWPQAASRAPRYLRNKPRKKRSAPLPTTTLMERRPANSASR